MTQCSRAIRRWLGAAAIVAAGLVLAACSGGSDQDAATPAGSTSAGPAGTSAASSAPPLGASPSPGATAPDLPVLGSHKTSDGRTQVQVDLNQVRVTGKIMEVTYTARNLDPVSDPQTWQIADFFSDGIYQKLTDGTNDTGLNSDGVYVVDPVDAKRYLVARDPAGLCVCSTDTSNIFVAPQQGVVLSAVFGAPPATVTSVDVFVPHAGTFTGVQVSR